MKAAATDQWRLLDLQALDTRAGQIAHRRRNLPETAAAEAARRALAAAEDDLLRARTEHSDLQRDVDKAEADVRLVRDRAARNRSRLEAGEGTPKDLAALQHELTSLARRQEELEEIELEIMERTEAVGALVEHNEAEFTRRQSELADAEAARQRVVEELDTEDSALVDERRVVSTTIPADLLDLYEKVRTQTGMGAALLSQRRCGGCQLELFGVDLSRIKSAAEDEVIRCEECRRILVRTGESGL